MPENPQPLTRRSFFNRRLSIPQQTAAMLEAAGDPIDPASRPAPLKSITAAASRLTTEKLGTTQKTKPQTQGWQEEAWELHDQIGEQHFLAHTLAGRLAQAHLYVGKLDPHAGAGVAPVPAEDSKLQELLDTIGGGPGGLSQILERAGLNLFVAGEFWLVGVPPTLMPNNLAANSPDAALVVNRALTPADAGDSILDLKWQVMSGAELSFTNDKTVKLKFGIGEGDTIEVDPDSVYLIRAWRSHPRESWQADSPTRASLPILRELLGLTMHIGAQLDSRLAGAGILLVPAEAAEAINAQAGVDMSDPEEAGRDVFSESLMEAMITPIRDRASASAVVPLTLTVPGETTAQFKYISFATNLDKESQKLRDEAIRRLALGQDAPPEILLGVGGMNHWGAWLVREDVVTTHLEPPLALICDALTTQFLRPVLDAMGVEAPEDYVVWYDVSHMVMRPNRADDAKDLYDRGELDGEALREELGFADSAAPESSTDSTDPVVDAALRLVTSAPSLMQNPGLVTVVAQLRAVMEGTPTPAMPTDAPAADTETSSEGGVPVSSSPEDTPATPEESAE